MGNDIDIIPSVTTIPTVGELVTELERVLLVGYEHPWVRDAFRHAPVADLRVKVTLSELVEGEPRRRLSARIRPQGPPQRAARRSVRDVES